MLLLSISRTRRFPQQPSTPDPETLGPETDVLRFLSIGDVLIPPPDEELYLDEFNEWYYEWNNPPENALGPPDDLYIESDTNAQWACLYSFENITLEGREIKHIILEGYTQYPNGATEEVDIDVYGFSSVQSFVWLGSLWGTTAWGWHKVRWIYEEVLERMPELADETEFNNMQILLYNYHGDAPDIVRVDSLRLKVWYQEWYEPEQPTVPVMGMQDHLIDVLTDLARSSDIEKLDNECNTITSDLGFHVGFIGYNLRADQSYRRDDITYWPCKDVEFRQALILSYDQLGIIPPIYGYTVTPVRSLVPPAQSRYYNTAVPTHPYNPGVDLDPESPTYLQLTYEEGSSTGILRDEWGGTFVDNNGNGIADPDDYWLCPDGVSPVPRMDIYTPLMEVAPTSYQHGAEFVADLGLIGLAATAANGNHGLTNLGRNFGEYLADVYDHADFDAYMVFYGLGRLPGQLFSLLHTSQDCLNYPGRRNAVGVNDPTIDELTETVKFSLDLGAIEAAAEEVQEMLYTPTLPNADNFALSYMTLYSRTYFNAFNPGLRGIVKSPGFGSDNMWTFLNMRWEPGHPYERLEGGDTVVHWRLADYPETFNPLSASSAHSWEILDRVYDPLTAINPYNHRDMMWLVSDWTITETAGGMEIDFTLRDDVEWQDGKPFTAYDVEFCLEFLRDYQVPRYAETWETLVDVTVTDATHLTIVADEASIDLFYDYADLGPMLPEHIWNRFGDPSDPVVRKAVLDYDPKESYNVASPPYIYKPPPEPYTPGPIALPSNVFGTGPWVFQFWDPVGEYDEMTANRNYFLTTQEIHDTKVEMFWEVGDVNRDGVINQTDLDRIVAAFGCFEGTPCYDPDCDLTKDGFIDSYDEAICISYQGWYREYPGDITDVGILEATTYPTAVPGQKVPISVTAKNKGLTDRTVNFTYYYDDTLIGYKIVTLPPCGLAGPSHVSFTWDTTGIPVGTYTIKVNATVVDGPDIDLSDNLYVNGPIQFLTPTISVKPEKPIVGSAGKNFSININIANAPYNNTWAWEFKLSWDANLLDIMDITEGTFLNQSGTWATTFATSINQAEGWALVGCSLQDDPIEQGQPLPYGDGILATLNFTVLDLGCCPLHLFESLLLDYDIDPYSHTTQDGEFCVFLGDVTRDGIVDDADVQRIKDAYGSQPGDPNWDPEADIWGPDDEPDGYISIFDLAMCNSKYGESVEP